MFTTIIITFIFLFKIISAPPLIEDVVVGETHNQRYFQNPSTEWRIHMTSQLFNLTDFGIINDYQLPFSLNKKFFRQAKAMGVTDVGEDDGDCGFRVLSWLISGTPDNHPFMRRVIVNFERQEGDRLALSYSDHKTGRQHVTATRINKLGTPMTEMELASAAVLLKAHLLLLVNAGNEWEWLYFSADGFVHNTQDPEDYRPTLALKLEGDPTNGHFRAIRDILVVGQ